jgi:hypothetical protein
MPQRCLLIRTAGFVFYLLAILSPVIDELQQPSSASSPFYGQTALRWIGLCLFVTSSRWQNDCHRCLARLRSGSDSSASSSSSTAAAAYGRPDSASFRLLVCPHYTAEMGVYLSFCCIRPSFMQALVLLWTVVNLSITATSTRRWYAEKWPEQRQTDRQACACSKTQ